jgi:hypothetical protein
MKASGLQVARPPLQLLPPLLRETQLLLPLQQVRHLPKN